MKRMMSLMLALLMMFCVVCAHAEQEAETTPVEPLTEYSLTDLIGEWKMETILLCGEVVEPDDVNVAVSYDGEELRIRLRSQSQYYHMYNVRIEDGNVISEDEIGSIYQLNPMSDGTLMLQFAVIPSMPITVYLVHAK